jgi:hypothetical protein
VIKKLKRKGKGQEEIAGFAVILVLVAIILLVFLVFYLKKPQSEEIQSYEVSSFIQSFLQFTTSCEQNSGNLSVQELIFQCEREAECSSGMKSCKVLNDTLNGILTESWKVGELYPNKGYNLNITSNGKEMLILKKGEVTQEWKGSEQDFAKGNDNIYILFNAYYSKS